MNSETDAAWDKCSQDERGAPILEKVITDNAYGGNGSTTVLKPGESMFNCLECRQPFQDANKLSTHVAVYHVADVGENMKFSCGICDLKFSKKWQCSAHIKTHRDQLNVEGMPHVNKTFACELCGHVFKTNKRVKEHKRVHTGDKPFSCDICGKSFSRQDRLKVHKRYHTGERPYQCPNCDMNFAENSTLFRHIATHDKTDDKPFTCDQCPRAFCRKFQLLAHMSAHQCQKKNKCEVCYKCFSAPSLLKEHMRVHSGEKPFPCSVCSKHFRNLAHVKRHMQTHTKTKPFHCVECEMSFGLQIRLDNHIHRTGHTGSNQFGCPDCKRTFKKCSNYSSHIKRHWRTESDVSSLEQEQVITMEEIQSSTSVVSESHNQADDTQNANIIQVLICTNETSNIQMENTKTDFENNIPIIEPSSNDKIQKSSSHLSNIDRDLSTVVIFWQNDLHESVLHDVTEPSKEIPTFD